MILAPGIVDLGVFAIDKPAFHFGGITRAALMPDQNPVLDMPAMIKHLATEGKPDLWSHPIAAATKGLDGRELAEIALMQRAGAKAVATGRQWIADSGIMLKLLQYCQSLDLPVIVHSEDGGLTGRCRRNSGGNSHPVRTIQCSCLRRSGLDSPRYRFDPRIRCKSAFPSGYHQTGTRFDPEGQIGRPAYHLWNYTCPSIPVGHCSE